MVKPVKTLRPINLGNKVRSRIEGEINNNETASPRQKNLVINVLLFILKFKGKYSKYFPLN